MMSSSGLGGRKSDVSSAAYTETAGETPRSSSLMTDFVMCGAGWTQLGHSDASETKTQDQWRNWWDGLYNSMAAKLKDSKVKTENKGTSLVETCGRFTK